MTDQQYFSDARRLFKLWKEYSGEDLLKDIEKPAQERLKK